MLRSRALWFASVIILPALGTAVLAQTPPLPSFEAASVKLNVAGGPRSGYDVQPGGHVTITNQTLRQIIRTAFDFSDIEVLGGPDWIGRDRWDILASAGNGDADPPWRAMLKSLLAERFMLQAHVESRERPIYALVLARGDKMLGPNIRASKSDIYCAPGDTCGTARASGNAEAGAVTSTAGLLPALRGRWRALLRA